jgi:hypothetical protein
MTHDDAFAKFRAEREAERAAEVKVTWRKVDPLTGGGWSGLGPDGQLVFVARRGDQYDYGDVIQDTRPWRRSRVGTAITLARAKKAAAALFNDAPTRRRKGAPVATDTIITADDLAGDGIEAVRAGKAPYARMRAGGKTIAYADDRKDGVVLNFASVEGLPARFDKAVTFKRLRGKGIRTTMSVDAKNVKTAKALLEWLAKQV